MFVYKTVEAGGGNQPSRNRRVESFFNIPERWSDRVTTNSLLVILCALVFGGLSRVTTFVPLAAFVGTVLVLAWSLGEGSTAEEPDWVNRLSLASTGLLYLGLGHCLGSIVFLALPLAGSLLLKR
jgi:hypothetical protein